MASFAGSQLKAGNAREDLRRFRTSRDHVRPRCLRCRLAASRPELEPTRPRSGEWDEERGSTPRVTNVRARVTHHVPFASSQGKEKNALFGLWSRHTHPVRFSHVFFFHEVVYFYPSLRLCSSMQGAPCLLSMLVCARRVRVAVLTGCPQIPRIFVRNRKPSPSQLASPHPSTPTPRLISPLSTRGRRLES